MDCNTLSRLDLNDLVMLAKEYRFYYVKEEALSLMRKTLASNEKHILGLELTKFELIQLITSKLLKDDIRIINMSKSESIQYLSDNFYIN